MNSVCVFLLLALLAVCGQASHGPPLINMNKGVSYGAGSAKMPRSHRSSPTVDPLYDPKAEDAHRFALKKELLKGASIESSLAKDKIIQGMLKDRLKDLEAKRNEQKDWKRYGDELSENKLDKLDELREKVRSLQTTTPNQHKPNCIDCDFKVSTPVDLPHVVDKLPTGGVLRADRPKQTVPDEGDRKAEFVDNKPNRKVRQLKKAIVAGQKAPAPAKSAVRSGAKVSMTNKPVAENKSTVGAKAVAATKPAASAKPTLAATKGKLSNAAKFF